MSYRKTMPAVIAISQSLHSYVDKKSDTLRIWDVPHGFAEICAASSKSTGIGVEVAPQARTACTDASLRGMALPSTILVSLSDDGNRPLNVLEDAYRMCLRKHKFLLAMYNRMIPESDASFHVHAICPLYVVAASFAISTCQASHNAINRFDD